MGAQNPCESFDNDTGGQRCRFCGWTAEAHRAAVVSTEAKLRTALEEARAQVAALVLERDALQTLVDDWEQRAMDGMMGRLPALEAERDAAVADAAALRAALRELEWLGDGDEVAGYCAFAACTAAEGQRHDRDCPIGAALKGTAGAALLARCEAAEAAVEAMRPHAHAGPTSPMWEALAAYEAARDGEKEG